jgi:hypothetical protein
MSEDASTRMLIDTCLQLGQRVGRLEKALRFYADITNWDSPSEGFALQYDPINPAALEDEGAIARAALEGEEAVPGGSACQSAEQAMPETTTNDAQRD